MTDYKTYIDQGIEYIHTGKYSEALKFITQSIE